MSLDSLFQQIKAVRISAGNEDPAIDLEKTDVLKYMTTRDLVDLAFIEGQQPDVFVLDRLSSNMMMNLSDRQQSRDIKAVIAFTAGCHRIELNDGTVLEPTEFHAGKEKVAKESWIVTVSEELGFPAVLEMGDLIIRMSQMGKRSKRAFF
jgi:hypothetical protein